MKYIKKPIPIDAWQFTYENAKKGIPDFIRIELQAKEPSLYLVIDDINHSVSGMVRTLEGQLVIQEGCYIIKGIHGEFYPCDAKIFEESYTEVK